MEINQEEWLKDRDEAFASADPEKVKEYCKKYDIAIPEDENTFLCGMHKAICNLFLSDETSISIEQYNKSYDWLVEHGSTPSIVTGGEE